MALRGGILWLKAEIDFVRLKLKALFSGKSLSREIERVTPRVDPQRMPAVPVPEGIREPAA
jgi:hypothetical protein